MMTNAAETFERILPALMRRARWVFRALDDEARDDCVAETLAYAWVTYARRAATGNLEGLSVNTLVEFARRQIRVGRRVGNRWRKRDVLTAVQLGRVNRLSWVEAVEARDFENPADVAQARVDFEAWRAALPARKREVADLLASGASGADVRQIVGISAARVSQLRRELQAHWEAFTA